MLRIGSFLGVGVVWVFFIASTEVLISRQRDSTTTAISHNIINDLIDFEEYQPSSRLKTLLTENRLTSLLTSLKELGVYDVSDFAYLDAKDRRRLWLEASLNAASFGEDSRLAVANWEYLMEDVAIPDSKIVTKQRLLSETVSSELVETQKQFLVANSDYKLAVVPSITNIDSSKIIQKMKEPRSQDRSLNSSQKPVICQIPKSLGSSSYQVSLKKTLQFNHIAVFINSSPNGRRYFGENFQRNYYESRVIPGIRTWGSRFPHMWIVLEKSDETSQLVSQCPREEFSSVPEYNCHGKPIIIAPCDNGYWGETGPCCKAQFSVRYLTVTRASLMSEIQWYLFTDDDTYFAPHSMLRFLNGYDASMPTVVSRGDPPGELTYGRLHTTNTKGYKCSNPHVKVGMLQPAIFSIAALRLLAPAIVDGKALTRTCSAFGITHDNALGILAWMHSLHFYVKGNHGSIHNEMAGAFNVTQCEEKKVNKCYEQGFEARADALRSSPAKFILHGVKMPHQFYALEDLFEEEAMKSCVGQNSPKHRFSAAQQTPLVPIEGYKLTKHGVKYFNELMKRTDAPASLLGSSPWPQWPVFTPEHCLGPTESVETNWDRHLAAVRSMKYSPNELSHVYDS